MFPRTIKKADAELPLLLDTHCWVWMQSGALDQFSRKGYSIIQKATKNAQLRLSVMSVWEVGLLELKGRLKLSMSCSEWVRQALTLPGLALVPLSPEIALESNRLPDFVHADPADRIIVATARITGSTLITGDRRLLDYGVKKHAAIISA